MQRSGILACALESGKVSRPSPICGLQVVDGVLMRTHARPITTARREAAAPGWPPPHRSVLVCLREGAVTMTGPSRTGRACERMAPHGVAPGRCAQTTPARASSAASSTESGWLGRLQEG